MRGARDEGLLVISAYRVSQKKGTRTGPHTAYAQQLDRMVQEGDLTLDPRSRILKDLSKLITEKRAEGLRLIAHEDDAENCITSCCREECGKCISAVTYSHVLVSVSPNGVGEKKIHQIVLVKI